MCRPYGTHHSLQNPFLPISCPYGTLWKPIVNTPALTLLDCVFVNGTPWTPIDKTIALTYRIMYSSHRDIILVEKMSKADLNPVRDDIKEAWWAVFIAKKPGEQFFAMPWRESIFFLLHQPSMCRPYGTHLYLQNIFLPISCPYGTPWTPIDKTIALMYWLCIRPIGT